jgi:hypothetical protein
VGIWSGLGGEGGFMRKTWRGQTSRRPRAFDTSTRASISIFAIERVPLKSSQICTKDRRAVLRVPWCCAWSLQHEMTASHPGTTPPSSQSFLCVLDHLLHLFYCLGLNFILTSHCPLLPTDSPSLASFGLVSCLRVSSPSSGPSSSIP